jgi:hypothetical protein
MPRASILIALLTWTCIAIAQGRKYTPIPPAAAQVIAALPNAEELDSIRQNYVSASLQLHDGADTILVEARGFGCGANNCHAWILESDGKTYRLLLDAKVIQVTHVLTSVTDGYQDIQTDQHGSATSADLRIYKYDGRQYRLTACLSRDYPLDENGQTSSKPVIKPFPCRR